MCSEYLIYFQTTSGKIMLPSFGIKKCDTINVEEDLAMLKNDQKTLRLKCISVSLRECCVSIFYYGIKAKAYKV